MSGSDSPALYFDTSALLPYYRQEALSQAVQDLLRSTVDPVLISELTEVEFASALSRWKRMKELPEADAIAIEAAFAEDINAGCYIRKHLLSQHYQCAKTWLSQRNTALRTLDALHLACAASHRALLVSADKTLVQAAQGLGIHCRLLT